MTRPPQPLTDAFPVEVAILPPPTPTTPLPPRPGPLASRTPLTKLPAGTRRVSTARVIVTRPAPGDTAAPYGAVFVLTDSSTGGAPEVTFAAPLAAPLDGYPTRTAESLATLPDGTVLAWSRSSGCGCGSRLRVFNPYRDASTLTLTLLPGTS